MTLSQVNVEHQWGNPVDGVIVETPAVYVELVERVEDGYETKGWSLLKTSHEQHCDLDRWVATHQQENATMNELLGHPPFLS